MRTVRRRGAITVAGALLLLMLVAPASQARSSTGAPGPAKLVPKDREAVRRIQALHRASEIFSRALLRVMTRRPGCSTPPLMPGVTYLDGAPTASVVAGLAPLRRPAAAADTPPAALLAFSRNVYRDGMRRVVAPDGRPLFLVVLRSTPDTSPDLPASCTSAARRDALRRAARAPKRVRRIVRRLVRLFTQVPPAPAAPSPPQDLIWLVDPATPTGFLGLASAPELRASGLTAVGGGDRGRVTGLVPDGVARVVLRYPRIQNQGPYYKPTPYPSAATVTTPVRDNVFRVAVPRPRRDADPASIEWLDSDGRRLRHVQPERVPPL